MRNWKNWLFPILSALAVAALALLPLRLSTLRDGELTGTVHAEALPEDSNFPFKPPELPGRIWLLVQFEEMPDYLTIMSHEPEGSERDREIQRLQTALADLGTLLPAQTAEQLSGIDGNSWEWDRCYLRDQTDLSSAGFTMIQTKKTGESLSATLDGESGQLLSLQFHSAKGMRFTVPPQELGEALLDRLGLAYEPADHLETDDGVYGWATFRLTECRSWFLVSQFDFGLSFRFRVDWETVEAETAESYGYPTDANSIQIR